MLSVRNLKKSFGTQNVLEKFDLDVPDGCVTVLIGPSGAGKTTLLRCLNFLEDADDGTLLLGDTQYDLKRMTAKDIRAYRMQTAFVFQNFNLFLNKTALQNVTEGLITARSMAKKEAENIGTAMLNRVGLSEFSSHYPHQLSGGQQQRVAIARALAAQPKIIFMDEPTSALDPELTEEVLSVIRRLADDGITMLVVTHEIAFAKTVATRAVFMEHGGIVEEGDAGMIFTNPAHQRTRDFLKL